MENKPVNQITEHLIDGLHQLAIWALLGAVAFLFNSAFELKRLTNESQQRSRELIELQQKIIDNSTRIAVLESKLNHIKPQN